MVIAYGPLARSVLGLGMVALAIFMSTVSLGSAPYGWKSGLDWNQTNGIVLVKQWTTHIFDCWKSTKQCIIVGDDYYRFTNMTIYFQPRIDKPRLTFYGVSTPNIDGISRIACSFFGFWESEPGKSQLVMRNFYAISLSICKAIGLSI